MQREWASVQPHRSYPEFVREFDQLQDDDVHWTPYYSQELAAMATRGLSMACYRDSAYWLTRKVLVFDLFVEPYSPQRVMRQFGRRQLIPPPPSLRAYRHTFTGTRMLHYFFYIILLVHYIYIR